MKLFFSGLAVGFIIFLGLALIFLTGVEKGMAFGLTLCGSTTQGASNEQSTW